MAYNIIFYFSDQQRWDTCGCFGQPLDITPNLDRLAKEGVKFDNAFSPQPVCGPCRALFQTGKYPTETGCFRNNIMLPRDVKTLANYMEEAGYETAYIGKWHLASDGELEKPPVIDHTVTAVPAEYRGGYSGFWRAADVLEFTSHGYDGYVFDENNRRIDFKGYRADCINDFALEYLDQYQGEKPFFMTVSQIEPHHQNDHEHYEGPEGSKEKYADFVLPHDLAVLKGNAAEEYPDYLGQCASLDENLGRLIDKLKEKGLYENTILIYVSDHGSHFKTRNTDSHLNGYDDYKRSGHDGALHVPFVIAGGPFRGRKRGSRAGEHRESAKNNSCSGGRRRKGCDDRRKPAGCCGKEKSAERKSGLCADFGKQNRTCGAHRGLSLRCLCARHQRREAGGVRALCR